MTNTVLVLPAGQTGTVIIKSLRKDPSLRIISADSNFLAPGLHLADKGFLIPPVSDPSFYEKIHDIISMESVDVIFPNGNFFTCVLANLSERLSKLGVRVLVSELSTVEKCIDKWKTYEYLHTIIPMPRSTIELDVKHILDYIDLPAIIKPRDGSGAQDAHKLEDLDDLQYYVRKVQNPIVQEFIKGQIYAAHILVNTEGKLLGTYVNKSLEFSNGIPTKLLIESREDIVDLAKEICSKLKFFGVICIQAIMDEKDSKPKLIDVNPRAGNGVILGVMAGCNLPLNAVYLALGNPIEPSSFFARSLYMSRYHEEIFITRPIAAEGVIPETV